MSNVNNIVIDNDIMNGYIDPLKKERKGIIDTNLDGLSDENVEGTMTGLNIEDPAAAREKVNGMMREVAEGLGPKLSPEAQGTRGIIT